ncbi:transmembrane protein UsgS [Myriangium duriaei CBS 260.36]|uniref:Transmembrane protein UsgS n=1 Tax=Myriangium duriaei CBS 260.36 TaxID=1168546 RepID=A0A9P4IZT6_9PEZI|nr:transmembrane protein UsgS [Myriangium duriaei CBS 260.36]
MSNFDINAIVRGAQLTVVGAYRALQNPQLFTSEHYRQAALAVAAGIAIRLIVSIPTIGVRVLLWVLSWFMDFQASSWDDDVLRSLDFIEHSVLQIPFFLMTFIRHLSPALDAMFMESLRWVDQTYVKKHKSEDPSHLRAMYYPNLIMYPVTTSTASADQKKSPVDAMIATLYRYGRKAAISIAVFALSYVPYVGRFVLPAVSFYTFNNAVGLEPALVIFGGGIFLPRRYLVMFLQSYFASRSLMRDLLDPYFKRVKFTKEQKKAWFRDREGVLFGFGVGFFVFLKLPLLGVLIYGVAEASTAFLITKITEPPPPPAEWKDQAQSQVHWRNKHDFLKLPLDKLDAYNITSSRNNASPDQTGELKGRQFT